MRPIRHSIIAIALGLTLAACSSEAPPTTAASTASTDAPAASTASTDAARHDPRDVAKASNPRPINRSTMREPEQDKPGDMPRITPVGLIECDQFADKLRQCVNSGVLQPEQRESVRGEYVAAMNAARFKGGDLRKVCTDLQEKIQPRLVQAGCLNL